MSLLMYDVHNNLAPDNIKNMFTKLSSVHSYRTRSVTNKNYYVEQVRTENMKRAFSISGALIWNSMYRNPSDPNPVARNHGLIT